MVWVYADNCKILVFVSCKRFFEHKMCNNFCSLLHSLVTNYTKEPDFWWFSGANHCTMWTNCTTPGCCCIMNGGTIMMVRGAKHLISWQTHFVARILQIEIKDNLIINHCWWIIIDWWYLKQNISQPGNTFQHRQREFIPAMDLLKLYNLSSLTGRPNIAQNSSKLHHKIELAQNCTRCYWWIITLQHQSVSDKTTSTNLQAGLCQGWQPGNPLHCGNVQIELCCCQNCTVFYLNES